MCGFFSHTEQFCNTSRTTYNLVLTYLSVVSVRFHRSKAQSHKTSYRPPPNLQMPITSPGCHPHFGVIGYKSEVPITFSLGLINLIELINSQSSGKNYLLSTSLLSKDMKSKGKACIGQSMSEDVCSVHALWGLATLPAPAYVQQPGNYPNPIVLLGV